MPIKFHVDRILHVPQPRDKISKVRICICYISFRSKKWSILPILNPGKPYLVYVTHLYLLLQWQHNIYYSQILDLHQMTFDFCSINGHGIYELHIHQYMWRAPLSFHLEPSLHFFHQLNIFLNICNLPFESKFYISDYPYWKALRQQLQTQYYYLSRHFALKMY